MGTVVSIELRAPVAPEAAIDAACAVLHDVDRRFSLYLPDSELSRLARGELGERDLSSDVRWVLAVCDSLALSSGGAFDARRHRPDGAVDPSAFVKGWAVELAAACLDAAGAANYCIGAGGDVLTRGEAAPGEAWRVGIRHPVQADRVAAVLEMRTGAVATSGLYERGDHIHDPRTGAVPRELMSLTVVGPDLGWADAYATAAFTMGLGGTGWVEDHPGYGAVAITADGQVIWSASAHAHRAPDLAEDPASTSALSGGSHLGVVS
jgi:thiamine biosynthesis lipoprotein